MLTKKRSRDLAIDRDGTRIFIKAASSGIHPTVFLIDGLPVTCFGRETTPYIGVAEALAWHRKELADTGKEAVPRIIEALAGVLAKFEAGEIDET